MNGGDPPNNILNAVSVPLGSVADLPPEQHRGGRASTTQQVTFRSNDSQAALLAFFSADMKLQGWQISSQGPARNDPACARGPRQAGGLGRLLLGDGLNVNATTFCPGGPARGATEFTVRLYQERPQEAGPGGRSVRLSPDDPAFVSTGSKSDGGVGSASR